MATLTPETQSSELRRIVASYMDRCNAGAANGALVPCRDLRARMHLGKLAFDELVIDLSIAGILSLHRHDCPAGCTEAQRAEMVQCGDTFYVGVALRRN